MEETYTLAWTVSTSAFSLEGSSACKMEETHTLVHTREARRRQKNKYLTQNVLSTVKKQMSAAGGPMKTQKTAPR